MVLTAALLIIIGGVCAFMGAKLFKILLPVVGFIAGLMVGFSGVQAIFGSGAVSLAIAIVISLITATAMAILSFMFFDIAVIILFMILGASVFNYLGLAIGLKESGFVLLLLGIAGAVLGLIFATSSQMSIRLVYSVTALLGVAYILGGIWLLVGSISLDQLQNQGIIPSILDNINQSFIWLFVWIAGSIVAMNSQIASARMEFLGDMYAYEETKK